MEKGEKKPATATTTAQPASKRSAPNLRNRIPWYIGFGKKWSHAKEKSEKHRARSSVHLVGAMNKTDGGKFRAVVSVWAQYQFHQHLLIFFSFFSSFFSRLCVFMCVFSCCCWCCCCFVRESAWVGVLFIYLVLCWAFLFHCMQACWVFLTSFRSHSFGSRMFWLASLSDDRFIES